MKHIYVTLMLLAAPSLAQAEQTLIFTTPSYVVTMIIHCEEDVNCQNDACAVVNRKTNETIHLKGHDVVRYCLEDQGDGPGKTPCEHIGYEFTEGGVCQANCVSVFLVDQIQRHPVFAEHHLKSLKRRLPVVNHLPVTGRLPDSQIESLDR